MKPPPPSNRVVVAGGGLAGMAAAAALAGAGFQVQLLERRPFLGGRATSYGLPGTAEIIDNCQHVLLGCCTNLLDFYQRLGVRDCIRFYDQVCFVTPDGRASVMRRDARPAPLHLLASLRGFHALGWRDKLAIIAALGAISFEFGMCSRTQLDSETMAAWLARHHQTPCAIEYFWRVVLTSTLNEDLELVSAWHGLQVLWKGFLAHRDAYLVGLSSVPLGDLYRLELPGVCVQPRTTVRSLVEREGWVERLSVETGGAESRLATVPGDWFVIALPFENAADLLPGDYSAFSHSPIVGIHLWFDRPVLTRPFAALLGRTIQWAFRKPGDEGYVQCVVSAARALLPLGRNEIIERAVRELDEFFPASGAKLLKGTVVKELRATFSAVPGMERARPPAETGFPNCFRAGDWTGNGWPPTMEAAVRSGYRAAELVARAAGCPQTFVKPEWEPEGLARFAPAARC